MEEPLCLCFSRVFRRGLRSSVAERNIQVMGYLGMMADEDLALWWYRAGGRLGSRINVIICFDGS